MRRLDSVTNSSDTREDAVTLERGDYVRIIIFSLFQVVSLVLFIIFARSIFTAFLAVSDSFYFHPTPTILQATVTFMEKFNRGLLLSSDTARGIPLPLIRAIPFMLYFAFSFFILTNARITKAIYKKRWQYLADRMTEDQRAFFLTIYELRSVSIPQR
jgi:hypothetical protein